MHARSSPAPSERSVPARCRRAAAWLLGAVLAGCAAAPPGPSTHEMLDAVLWVQRSGEYSAVARQIYGLARERLDQALADPTWSAALEQGTPAAGLPPAVILDLDETVLDNGRYEARLVLEDGAYSPASFRAWCEEQAAGAVPGVGEFLDHAVARGVAVFYYSRRHAGLRGCTAGNLRRLGLPLDPDRLWLNDGTTKSAMRARIARSHRIVLVVGDNLDDFVDGSRAPSEARRALAERHAGRWGRGWILLPNPMYGHWEATFYDFDHGTDRAEQLRRKYRALRP